MSSHRIWISACALSAAAVCRDTAADPQAADLATDSPVGLMYCFESAYEGRDLESYAGLFTADFRFHPSDPEVAMRHPVWTRVDEIASADHLFHGFTDARGIERPAAASIELTLDPYRDLVDPEHVDSTAYYRRYEVPSVTLSVVTVAGDWWIERQRHDFYVVRGDAAVLTPDQEPSVDRWYIRKWVENPGGNLYTASEGDPDRVSSALPPTQP
jgi:hypothetical protein